MGVEDAWHISNENGAEDTDGTTGIIVEFVKKVGARCESTGHDGIGRIWIGCLRITVLREQENGKVTSSTNFTSSRKVGFD